MDYKFSVFNGTVYDTIKVQLYAYARLIEDSGLGQADKGFVVFIRSNNYVETVRITRANKQLPMQLAQEILDLIERNLYPKPTKYRDRCRTCEYNRLCEEGKRIWTFGE